MHHVFLTLVGIIISAVIVLMIVQADSAIVRLMRGEGGGDERAAGSCCCDFYLRNGCLYRQDSEIFSVYPVVQTVLHR